MLGRLVAGWVLVANFLGLAAAGEPPAARLILGVDLRDGSHIIGQPNLSELEVRTDYAVLKLRLALISTIEFQTNQTDVTVSLQNGDHLLGHLSAQQLTLATVFGNVSLPLTQITRLANTTGNDSTSLEFDGAQNYLTIAPSADFFQAPLTIEFWFKWTGPVKEGSGVLGVFDGHQQGWAVQTKWNDKIRFVAFGLRGGGFWGGLFDSSIGVCDGQWHHVAIVYTSPKVSEFVDGRAAGTWPVTGQIVPSALPLDVGGWPHVAPAYIQHDYDWFTPARICELRISHAARYDAEFTPPPQLTVDGRTLGYWRFGEGTGSTVRDQSSNSHEGKLTGNPPPTWQKDRPAR